VFAPEIAAVVYANHGVRPSIVDPDWNNFAPRFGFAYRPALAKNTVVRGGFGTYYATDNFNEEQFKAMHSLAQRADMGSGDFGAAQQLLR
jgi:hypothetical protein